MASFKKLMKSVYREASSYETEREIEVQNWKMALLFRSFQFVLFVYIVCYEIVYDKGYQSSDTAISVVTTKVKGLGYIRNATAANPKGKRLVPRIFDTANYVVPPSEFNSVFVMTNFYETTQHRGVCDEDPEISGSQCNKDDECDSSMVSNNWNGIPTGKCIQSSLNSSVHVCEIDSWCPIEKEKKDDDRNLIQNALNFTIFIKNNIKFKALIYSTSRNILPHITNVYIANCSYDKIKDPYCPVFKLSTILEEAESDPKERELMLKKGSVLNIEISWDCNYDFSSMCYPEYSFSRHDIPFHLEPAASGFNFRFNDESKVNETVYRSLVKAYGLKFIINVNSKAGKFDFIELIIKLGAGVGILGVAKVVSDLILLHCTSNKKTYREFKKLELKQKSKEENEEERATKMSLTCLNSENNSPDLKKDLL